MLGTSFVDHRLQNAVTMVILEPIGHFLIMLNISPFVDGAVFVYTIEMTASNFSSVMGLANITSMFFVKLQPFRDVGYSISYPGTGGLGSFTLGKRSIWFPNEQHIFLGCESTPSALKTSFIRSLFQ